MRTIASMPADVWLTPDDIRRGCKVPSDSNYRAIAFNMHRFVRQPFHKLWLEEKPSQAVRPQR